MVLKKHASSITKRFINTLAAILFLWSGYGCKQPTSPVQQHSAEEEALEHTKTPSIPKMATARSEGAAGATDKDQTSVKPPAATLEERASAVNVRVAFGGLPPRDYAGAIIHRDDVGNDRVSHGKDRFVLTLLKDWKR